MGDPKRNPQMCPSCRMAVDQDSMTIDHKDSYHGQQEIVIRYRCANPYCRLKWQDVFIYDRLGMLESHGGTPPWP